MTERSTKLIWEQPYIQPHRLGAFNKFGKAAVRDDVVRQVFGVPVEDLIEKFGSPVFVTSEHQLRGNVRKIKRVFERRYSSVVHGWSYKTNYISAICNILRQEGSWAEVVSQFEYEKAKALGVPGSQIIFNGPNKTKEVLARAIADGVHIHVDHLDELKLVEAIAIEQDRIVPVALRLNFETGYTEPWSRFGFNIESGQAHQAAKIVLLSPHLSLNGLHSHIGTFIREPRAYAEQVRVMCSFMQEIENSSPSTLIEYIDIGGGFPSINALQGVYLPPEHSVPDINEYADAICDSLIQNGRYRRELGRPIPKLIFESGRAIVDDAQVLITSVAGTKRLPDGRRACILNAGTNLMFTAYWFNHSVKLTREPSGTFEDTVLYGPLCMNIDVVKQSAYLPPLIAGDHLVIGPTGAYNNTQWLQFIEYRPNVVLVHEDGNCSIIRRAEDLTSMLAHDVVPDHLTCGEAQTEGQPRHCRDLLTKWG